MKKVNLNENVSVKSHKHNCDIDTNLEILSKNPSKFTKDLASEFDKRLKILSKKCNKYNLYIFDVQNKSYCFLTCDTRNNLFHFICNQFDYYNYPIKVALSRSFFSFKNSNYIYKLFNSNLSYLKEYISFIDGSLPVSLLFPVRDPEYKLIYFVLPYVESSL